MKRTVLIAVLTPFLVLSGAALWNHGYLGIFQAQFANSATLQVLADLLIALTLFMAWMWRHAREDSRSPWPWIALILTTGSIAALIYLIVYGKESRQTGQRISDQGRIKNQELNSSSA